MRTQADDLRSEIKKLELALYYTSDPKKFKEIENKISEARSILYNIM
jgi:hypothetical protein